MSDGNGTRPARPQLADPASTPRHGPTGRQQRAKPIFRVDAGWSSTELTYWEVEVTPITGASSTGRGIDAPAEKRGTIFEVRALYYGTGLPEFGSQPNTRLVPHVIEEDAELACAIGRRWAELLRSGRRDSIDLLVVAKEVKDRRAG